jgi:hypothetical protein
LDCWTGRYRRAFRGVAQRLEHWSPTPGLLQVRILSPLPKEVIAWFGYHIDIIIVVTTTTYVHAGTALIVDNTHGYDRTGTAMAGIETLVVMFHVTSGRPIPE